MNRDGELEPEPPKVANESLLRGLKGQAVRSFVQYLKQHAPGEVHADMTVTLNEMSYDELDRFATEFLER